MPQSRARDEGRQLPCTKHHPPCGFPSPSDNTPPCEAPMPFSIRLYRRFPVHCSVTYNAEPFQGQGTVWRLSRSRTNNVLRCVLPPACPLLIRERVSGI